MNNAQLQKLLNKNGITLRGKRAVPKGKGVAPKSRMTEELERLLPIGEAAPIVNHSNEGVIEGLLNSVPPPNEPSLTPWGIDMLEGTPRNPGTPYVPRPFSYVESPPDVIPHDENNNNSGNNIGLNLYDRGRSYRLRSNGTLPTNPYRRAPELGIEPNIERGGYRRTRRPKRKSSMKKRK